MNDGVYNKLLMKQARFEKIESLIDSFKESIFKFNEDVKIISQITIEVDEGGIMYIDYLGRMIKVLFINNLDSVSIEFYLEVLNKNNTGYIFDKVVVVVSDHLGNLECKELEFTNQLYRDIHHNVLNHIIDLSTKT